MAMQRPFYVLPAPVVFGAVLGLAQLLGMLWPLELPLDLGWAFAGWTLIDIGAVLLLWTAWLMIYRKTTLSPFGKPQRLLREGPFRFSRNPIYIGMLLLYLGVAMLWSNLWCFLLLPVLLVLLQVGVIRHEEKLLLRHFGEDYRQYCLKVRRWL